MTDDAPEDDPWLAKRVGGRYRVVRRLGRGGMGAVYEALQEDLGRKVALKVLHPHLTQDPETAARFRREAEAAASLGHPSIVQVTDFGVAEGGAAFLVMELLVGASLAGVLDREGRLAPRRAASIVVQVLSALSAAHARGIVHRDLKPENVFVTTLPGVGDVVKLLDFGVAKLVEAVGDSVRLTATGAVLGTPAYMSPEQARGRGVDARTDVYAAGVLLYEALAGQCPFHAPNYHAMLFAILEDVPTPLATLRPELDPALVAVVERAMARDPAARFQSAAELLAALEPFTRGGPHAEPASTNPSSEPLTAARRALVESAPTQLATPSPLTRPSAPEEPRRDPQPTPSPFGVTNSPPTEPMPQARARTPNALLWGLVAALACAVGALAIGTLRSPATETSAPPRTEPRASPDATAAALAAAGTPATTGTATDTHATAAPATSTPAPHDASPSTAVALPADAAIATTRPLALRAEAPATSARTTAPAGPRPLRVASARVTSLDLLANYRLDAFRPRIDSTNGELARCLDGVTGPWADAIRGTRFVEVRFNVDAAGRVSRARLLPIYRGPEPPAAGRDCVVAMMRRLEFGPPATAATGEMFVGYNLTLR